MNNLLDKISNVFQKKNAYVIVLCALVFVAILASVYNGLVKHTFTHDNSSSSSENSVSSDLHLEPNEVVVNDIRSGEIIVKKFDYPVSNINREDFTLDQNGRVNFSGEGYFGIDVSEHQGDIDWEKVKADGVDFAIIRLGYRGATKGDLWLDANFEKNIQGAIDNDIKVGVYFFSQAMSEKEAEEEATYVLNTIREYKKHIDYPVVFDWELVDIENSRTDNALGSDVASYANSFCSKVRQAGYDAMVYTNKSFGYRFYDLEKFNDFPIWIAEYEDAPSFYYDYKIWQYTDSGKVDGINTTVDMNISFHNYK